MNGEREEGKQRREKEEEVRSRRRRELRQKKKKKELIFLFAHLRSVPGSLSIIRFLASVYSSFFLICKALRRWDSRERDSSCFYCAKLAFLGSFN